MRRIRKFRKIIESSDFSSRKCLKILFSKIVGDAFVFFFL